LGMHRSGTSLIAQWMHKCGINMGDDLLEPNFDNEQGFYEDKDFYNLHVEILKDNSLSDTGVQGDLSDIDISTHFEERLRSNIRHKNSLRDQWGWKEPRTCMFLDCYKKYIPEAKYLIVYRDPKQVVDSLLRRDVKTYNIRFKRQGIKGRIKAGLKEWYLKDTLKESAKNYIEKWVFYNQRILDFIEKRNREDYLIFNIKDIFRVEPLVFEKLQQWSFSFNQIDIGTIYDNQLMQHKISIFDEKLVENNTDIGMIIDKYNNLKEKQA